MMKNEYKNLTVRKITPEEYTEFIDRQDYLPLQGIGSYHNMKATNREAELFGGYIDGKLEIAMNVQIIPALKVFSWGYSLYGPVMKDPSDLDLIKAFIPALKKVLPKNMLYLQYDSAHELRSYHADGSINENGFDHSKRLDEFRQAGFIIRDISDNGYNLDYQPEWVSVLDLAIPKDPSISMNERVPEEMLADKEAHFTWPSPNELFKKMDSKTRSNINYTQKPYIITRELSFDELPILERMTSLASDKHHFHDRDLGYYQNLTRSYGKRITNLCTFLDLDLMKETLEKQLKENERQLAIAKEESLANPALKKKARKYHQLQEEKQTLEKRMEEYQELSKEYSGQIPLAAACFLTSPTETAYMFSGADYALQKFKGSSALQWYMIQEALKRKQIRYNFMGISGKFEPEDTGFGVFNFKKGFGAVPRQYSGIFIYPFNPFMTKMYFKHLGLSE